MVLTELMSHIRNNGELEDRDLIIEYREVFASALRLADRLVASKQREAKVASCGRGVSALPETIDRHWEEVCQGSECWRDWWNSGRPKQLRHAPELTILPTQPGNRTPPEATPSSTSVAEPPPPPPPSSTPVSLPTSSGLNTSTSQTHSTATSTQNQTHTNTLPAVPPTPPATPVPPTPQQHQHQPQPQQPRLPPRAPLATPPPGKEKYKKKNRNSEVRGASTTQGAVPSRRQTPAKPTQICRYCNRKGHSTEDCHTRTAELRQERLLRQVLSEGGYLAAASPSVTPHLQPFPQSRPFFSSAC
ncbi:ESCRT-I complex subunit tsg101-like [Scylla paramamosain]|uniref:ESCRT-I complex subunit tsg101-like n=1 Tax=Scylla paramamosain TaxID=85552 RepID=UPI003082716E